MFLLRTQITYFFLSMCVCIQWAEVPKQWLFTRKSACLHTLKTLRKNCLQISHHMSFASCSGVAFAQLQTKLDTLMDPEIVRPPLSAAVQ